MTSSQLSNGDWIAISSAFVALCALAISIWQGYIARRHNVLSVRPHLEIVVASSIHGKNFLVVKNGGLGPAIIDTIQFSYQGKAFFIRNNASYQVLFDLLGRDADQIKAEWYVPDLHSAISPGESIQVFAASSTDNPLKLKEKFDFIFAQVGIAVEYRCMYNKKYISQLDALVPAA